MTDTKTLIEWADKHLMTTAKRAPVALVRGEGVRVWDSDGKEYLDFTGGIAVTIASTQLQDFFGITLLLGVALSFFTAITVSRILQKATLEIGAISTWWYGVNKSEIKSMAKTVVKDIKGLNLKVQASINDDLIRVTGKDKDELQAVIQMVKGKDYPIDIQFKNYR